MPAPEPWTGAAWRLLAAATLGAACAVFFEDALVKALLPALRAWLLLVDDSYITLDLALIAEHGERLVQRIAVPAGAHAVDGHVIQLAAQSRLVSAVASGLVLQPLVLGLALVVAMPARDALELAARLAVAPLLLALVVLLDVPLLLYGYAWYQETRALAPQHFSPLVIWGDAMNAGGRHALTVCAAAASIALARWLRRRRLQRTMNWTGSVARGRAASPAHTSAVTS